MKLTDEKAALLERDFYNFIDESRRNFAQLFKDRETDAKLLADIYKTLGQSRSETHLLSNKVQEAKDKVADHTSTVSDEVQGIKEVLETKPVVIVERGLTLKGVFTMLFKKGKDVQKLSD